MMTRTLLVLSLLVSMMALPAAAESLRVETVGCVPAEPTAPSAQDPAERFRQVLVDVMGGLEGTLQLEPRASRTIRETSHSEMETWLGYLEDPERFYSAAQRVMAHLEAGRAAAAAAVLPGATGPSGSPDEATGRLSALTSPFVPDYPPNSGGYKIAVLDTLRVLGFAVSPSDRCDDGVWGDFYMVWYQLALAMDHADAACQLAGCDPSGAVCLGVCGLVDLAKIVFRVATVPVDLCQVHEAAVNAAEIEAAYENSASTLLDLASHDTAIKQHLTYQDARLDAHDANLLRHDAEIKSLLDGLQRSVDNDLEQRRVHLQVIEVINRDKYLVAATEGGKPVDVEFTGMHVLDDRTLSFLDLLAQTRITTVEPGIYLVDLDLRPTSPDKIFRLRARHPGTPDHYGEVLFHRIAGGNIASGG